MNEMKGVAPIAIAVGIIVVVIAAVGVWYVTRAPPPEEVTTITVLAPAPLLPKWLESAKPYFEEEYPNIKVNIESFSWGEIESKTTLAISKSGVGSYDAVFVDWGWIPKFAEPGWIVPMEDYVPEYLEEASGWAIDHASYKGHLYGIGGFDATSMVLIYNKDMLAEAGIDQLPETLGELVDQCLQIKEQGIVEYPFSIGLKALEGLSQTTNIIMRAYGGETWLENGSPNFNDEAGRATFSFMRDIMAEYEIVNPGNVELMEHEAWTQLAEKKAVFGINWDMYVASLNDPEVSEAAGSIEMTLVPATELGEPVSFPSGGGLALPANAPHPEAAKEFLKWNSTREAHKLLLEVIKLHGPYPDLYEEFTDEAPWLGMFPEIESKYEDQPKSLWYWEVSEIWAEEIQNAAIGTKSAEQALNDCEQRVNEVIAVYVD